jgi:hypothetical protein
MNYLVIDTKEYNFTHTSNGIFYAIPVLSGLHKGKFACFENALELFPEIIEPLTYETIDLDILVFQVDYTAPSLLPYAVEIPVEYRWVFPDNKFILNGFEIPLDDYQSTKVVNLAYFQWVDFRNELDRKDDEGNFVYATLKRSLMELWDYVALQVTNNNIIVL